MGECIYCKPSRKFYVIFYIVSCLVGTTLELVYGAFWSMVGNSPWVYPNSPLQYTSLAVLPLWGFCGLICISVYRTLLYKEVRCLRVALLSLALATLWVLVYSRLIA